METNKVFYFTVLGLILLVGNCQGAEPKVTCSYYGEFISDIYDCKSYYYCDATLYPEHRTCPGDSYWDANDLNCFPWPVTCAGTTPIACSHVGQQIPDPYDCTAYYYCSSTVTPPIHSYCTAGYSFSAISNSCIYPPDPYQCEGAIITTPTYPVTCSYAGQRIPDPYDCTAYYDCSPTLTPIHYHCAAGYSFSVISNTCIYPYDASQCYGAIITTPTYPVRCSYVGQRIPDPYDCTGYYDCSSTLTPIHSYCPAGYSFSIISLTCIYPYNPAQCQARIDCTQVSQVLPDTIDCSTFYVCDNRLYSDYHRCSTGLFYDPQYASCNLAERVSCTGGYRPPPIPTATPVTPAGEPLPSCGYPSQLLGNIYDCRKFWKCSNVNYAEPFICPDGLNFDTITYNCEFPAAARCA